MGVQVRGRKSQGVKQVAGVRTQSLFQATPGPPSKTGWFNFQLGSQRAPGVEFSPAARLLWPMQPR